MRTVIPLHPDFCVVAAEFSILTLLERKLLTVKYQNYNGSCWMGVPSHSQCGYCWGGFAIASASLESSRSGIVVQEVCLGCGEPGDNSPAPAPALSQGGCDTQGFVPQLLWEHFKEEFPSQEGKGKRTW